MINRPTRLVLAGSLTGEVRLATPHTPAPGGVVRATQQTLQIAGGFRALIVAKRLGLDAAVGGPLGTGAIAKMQRAAVHRHDIDDLTRPAEGDQGYAVTLVEPNGLTTSIKAVGVEVGLGRPELDALGVRDDDAVFIDGYDLGSPDAGRALAQWCSDGGLGDAMLITSPGPLLPDIGEDILDAVLARTDVLVLDTHEFAMLVGVEADENASSASDAMLSQLAPGAVILGRRGVEEVALLRLGEPAYLAFGPEGAPVALEETAGEVLIGVLAAELARGLSLEEVADHIAAAWHADPPERVIAPDGMPLYRIGPTRASLEAVLAVNSTAVAASRA